MSLRIAIIARADASDGGAGEVAERLVAGLRSRGHEVAWWFKKSLRDGERPALRAWPGDAVARQLVGLEPAGVQAIRRLEAFRPDVVHLHDPVVALGIRASISIARAWPTVVTLHDFSAIFGGCLYPADCSRGPSGCGDCPALGQWPLPVPLDSTRRQHRRVAPLPRTTLAVAPSRWLAQQARTGAWAERDVRVVPNPVDTTVFRSAEGPERTRDRPRLTMVATRLDDRRKGIDLALDALTRCRRDWDVTLVGRGTPPGPTPTNASVTGPIFERAALADVLRESDVVLVPSREETFGLVAAEAMACGAAVVVSPTGALTEVVTGAPAAIVATELSAASLARALDEIPIPEAELRRLQANHAADAFGPERFVARYEAVYTTALAR